MFLLRHNDDFEANSESMNIPLMNNNTMKAIISEQAALGMVIIQNMGQKNE